MRVSYYDDDTAKAITQAGVSVSYGLDVAGRRTAQTTRRTLETTVTESVTNHYADDSDNPAWVTTSTVQGSSTTVYAGLLTGSDVSLSLTTTGGVTSGELALANPRGDVSATITLPADQHEATGLDGWTRYTEYGTPVAAPFTGAGGAAANGYGWLGAKQRTTTQTGILLMGARLYNPVTGLFTSLDPIYGGNDTPYAYPNDPINKQDTTGQAWWRVGMVAASFIPGPIGWVASGALAVDAVRRGRYAEAALSLLGPAGRGLKYAARITRIARSTKSWRAAKGAIKHVVKNGNNTFRVNRARVSLGPHYKHWKRLPRWRRAVDRIHIHTERKKLIVELNTRRGQKVLYDSTRFRRR